MSSKGEREEYEQKGIIINCSDLPGPVKMREKMGCGGRERMTAREMNGDDDL